MATTIERAMTRSGFCQYPSPGSHVFCHQGKLPCDCPCHADIAVYDDGVRIGETPTVPEDLADEEPVNDVDIETPDE